VAYDVAAWLITATLLLLALPLHLLPALLAGLLVYELVHVLAPRLHILRIRGEHAKVAAIGVLALSLVVLIGLTVTGSLAFFRRAGGADALLQKMAEILDAWQTKLPPWLVAQLPADTDELRAVVVGWLQGHAETVQRGGAEVGRTLLHMLVGLAIGALVALREARPLGARGPLARAMEERAGRLGEAFRGVVFAQVRISAINTALTGLYLAVALPLSGVHLPLGKTMIAVTFLTGLLPVIGNLISNTMIVVLSLSVSFEVAVASLVFLIVVHKLEYFLNAQIVGRQVHAGAWELLLAMLLMESAFGVPGLVAAPIYYAYLKNELVSRKLV